MNVRVDDLYLIFLVLYLMFRCIASDVFRVSMPAKFNSLSPGLIRVTSINPYGTD